MLISTVSDVTKRVKRGWAAGVDGKINLVVRYRSKPLEFAKGKNAIELTSRPEAAIHYYYQIFHTCMASNTSQLSKYEIPESNGLVDDMIYNEVKYSDWWQRRGIGYRTPASLQCHNSRSTISSCSVVNRSKI